MRRRANIWKTQLRNTALICAAMSGHIYCVRALVEGGAEKNAKDHVRFH